MHFLMALSLLQFYIPIIEPYAFPFFRAAKIWNLFDKFSDLYWGLFVKIIDPPLKNINGGEGS